MDFTQNFTHYHNFAFAANQERPTLTTAAPIPFPDSHILSPNITVNSANTVFTVAKAGTYLVSYQINIELPGARALHLFVNGVSYDPAHIVASDVYPMNSFNSTVLVNLTAGSTVAVWIYGAYSPSPSILKMGANAITIVQVA